MVILLLLAIPAELFAKAETSKIIIKGADLSAPIEITDPKTLANFFVWTGTGTSCTGACSTPSTESFIVDWSKPIADHPSGLHRYEVSFYAKMPDERLIYLVIKAQLLKYRDCAGAADKAVSSGLRPAKLHEN